VNKSKNQILADLSKAISFSDGAMGTCLQKQGHSFPYESLLMMRPEVIRDLHQSYQEAGSNFILSHSFGLHEVFSDRFQGLASVEELQKRSWKVLREVSGDFYPVASLGASGFGFQNKLSGKDGDKLKKSYEKFFTRFSSWGARVFLVETITHLAEAMIIIEVARDTLSEDHIFILSFSPKANGDLPDGTVFSIWTSLEKESVVDILGVNCAAGLQESEGFLPKFLGEVRKPIWVKLNTGGSFQAGDEGLNAEDFAQNVLHFSPKKGVIWGACCGSSPDYIRRICSDFQKST
jgi:5-methyltetrahydrofolate--homocysteine methyltransferase